MTPEKDMELPDLSSLPPWALVLLMVSIAVILVITRFGITAGAKAGPASSTSQPIAGAIIDGRKADDIIRAIEKNTTAIQSLVKATYAQVDATKLSSEGIDNARADMRELTREIVRSGRGGR